MRLSTFRAPVVVASTWMGKRVALLVAVLVCAAVGGGVGSLVAPVVGQPRDAGFWAGATVTLALYLVVTIGAWITRARWLDRVGRFLR
ncbi:hypothetical protein Cch01nite_05570 [Cellulomonas chitinilytica]|uniref:Uncharacterized protein n=1 Tax=Cellulomonas chitinilytica TaxID=398759 RepID=A0A919NY93_9CELL|nr:hypothetical protein [Cellulomonas chitinilytica]GIG19833.1 hypothetical protein Cch01nite_05570 [Cellulomonas chitinilytica]